MAEVLSVPPIPHGYYRRPQSSPRCRSPQPSYTPPYEQQPPISRVPLDLESYNSFEPNRLSPPPSSTASSPRFSAVRSSSRSPSPSSSISSAICFDSEQAEKEEDSLFFPVYDYALSPSPSPDLFPSESQTTEDALWEEEDEDGATECPSRQSSTPEAAEDQHSPPSTDGGAGASALRPNSTDDTFLRHEPSRHVDYLSHDWKEEDIWSSWKYIVCKRSQHLNVPRLENALWRTWAKKKNFLRTVSPGTLNWLKDCDVTWLYGPLSLGVATSTPPASPVASPADKTPLRSCKTKPILKKRSMSEIMLQRSLSTSSLLKQATAVIESQQLGHNNTHNNFCRPPIPSRTNSDYHVSVSFSQSSKLNSGLTSDYLTSDLSTGAQSPLTKKHISFNDIVQQCIAVETDDDEDHHLHPFDHNEHSYDGDYESSSDEGLMMATSRRTRKWEPRTIAHLPETTLKFKDEVAKKKDSSAGSSRFLSLFGSKQAETATSQGSTASRAFLLEDDDDMMGLDWEPDTRFAVKTPGSTHTRESNSEETTDDFQLPNFNAWDEDDATANGLFGRAVDAVNTARDIAHVLWNVGWRR